MVDTCASKNTYSKNGVERLIEKKERILFHKGDRGEKSGVVERIACARHGGG